MTSSVHRIASLGRKFNDPEVQCKGNIMIKKFLNDHITSNVTTTNFITIFIFLKVV